MIYFDTDILINYLVKQDLEKHVKSVQLYREASEKGLFFCSLLCLQEASFVLSRLKIDSIDIEIMITELLMPSMAHYNAVHFKRAIELAKKIGFSNINDCLHTAIAEENCTEMYTFNKADFKRLQNHTDLKITIL